MGQPQGKVARLKQPVHDDYGGRDWTIFFDCEPANRINDDMKIVSSCSISIDEARNIALNELENCCGFVICNGQFFFKKRESHLHRNGLPEMKHFRNRNFRFHYIQSAVNALPGPSREWSIFEDSEPAYLVGHDMKVVHNISVDEARRITLQLHNCCGFVIWNNIYHFKTRENPVGLPDLIHYSIDHRITFHYVAPLAGEAEIAAKVHAIRSTFGASIAPEMQSDDDNVCKICYENEITICLAPCGHTLMCSECAAIETRCPICRQHIHSKIRIFRC